MSQYGYIIDSDLLPQKSKVYGLFSSYFGNPRLSKIESQDNCSVYAAKVDLQLRENRYLIVSTAKDSYPKGSQFKLGEIKWTTLQTRNIPRELDCLKFSYNPSRKAPFDSRVFLKERKETMTTYTNKDYNFTMCLLHTDNSKFQYPDLGIIASALETYNAIVKIET